MFFKHIWCQKVWDVIHLSLNKRSETWYVYKHISQWAKQLKNSATNNLCLLRKIKEFYRVYNIIGNKCFSEFCLLCYTYLPSIEPTYLHITNYPEILIFLCCTIPTWRFYCLSLNRNFKSLPHKVESVLIKKISLMHDFFLKNNFFNIPHIHLEF